MPTEPYLGTSAPTSSTWGSMDLGSPLWGSGMGRLPQGCWGCCQGRVLKLLGCLCAGRVFHWRRGCRIGSDCQGWYWGWYWG